MLKKKDVRAVRQDHYAGHAYFILPATLDSPFHFSTHMVSEAPNPPPYHHHYKE